MALVRSVPRSVLSVAACVARLRAREQTHVVCGALADCRGLPASPRPNATEDGRAALLAGEARTRAADAAARAWLAALGVPWRREAPVRVRLVRGGARRWS